MPCELSDNGGSASRFFMNCDDNFICSLCYNTLRKDNKDEKIWKPINMNGVENNLKIIQAIKENIVHWNVEDSVVEKSVQLVRYVGNLCEECGIDFVREVVEIKNLDFNQQESKVIQDFTRNYRKCILLQNLVSYVEKWDNIDTTQTTTDLLKLFGYANRVIINYIQKIKKLEQRRFLYTAKAQKDERNYGLDGWEEKKKWNKGGGGVGITERENILSKNYHPTVKPLSLMRYLCRLITPKKGLVIDPFFGTGTTGMACIKEGFNFIGIEIDPDYCKIAEARINHLPQRLDNIIRGDTEK